MVDRHYSLNLEPWSARTLFVHEHADLAQKYRKLLSLGCARRKKILFSCPDALISKLRKVIGS